MRWGIVYFKTKDGDVPAEDFFDRCPAKVEARFYAVLEAVRGAPPALEAQYSKTYPRSIAS